MLFRCLRLVETFMHSVCRVIPDRVAAGAEVRHGEHPKESRRFRSMLMGMLTLSAASPGMAAVIESEVCVYGGTSGGVAAAVQAKRMGKSAVLVVFNQHVGGMSSAGLGVTDRGNAASISGISAEFYERVGARYGSSTPVYFFEPHVAELIFTNLLAETGVPVCFNQRLSAVTKTGRRITEIAMEDGTVYRAKQFIDTTYEGDLMAMAGATFTVGREGSVTYGESLAGVRSAGSGHDFDPYVTPGDPASGLLKFVYPGTPGVVGTGDEHVQGYNFRLCLTQAATNKIVITPPAGYSASDYELFARYVESRLAQDGSVNLGQLIHIQKLIPNGKTDINANGELSTDWVGGADTWATNTYAGRAALQQAHEDYIRGLLYFYQTSPRIPANIRTEAQSWGLAADEFTDTGGWPHQLYVREARRMVSDYVMIQHDADGRRVAPDPIALASYALDSHGVRRLASGGRTVWEGGMFQPVPLPYGISYRSIVPRVGEVENLFCTFALSASQVAFSSVRMEPVFVMTSQAAGAAAALAIDDQVPVQSVLHQKLAAQLRADALFIEWPTSTLSGGAIVMDEEQAARSSGWTTGANPGGYQGDYFHDQSTGKGAKWIRYYPNLPVAGTYDVSLWWVGSSNRSTNAPVDIIHVGGTNRLLLNQRLPGTGWVKIFSGSFETGLGSSVIISNEGTAPGTYVIADAVRLAPAGTTTLPPVTPNVDVVAGDAVAGEWGPNPGSFSIVRSGPTNTALTVNFSITGTASPGEDYAALPGSVTLPAGAVAAKLAVQPAADELPEGAESVTLTLAPSAAYTASILPTATIAIFDRPWDQWRFLHFSTTELEDPQISGDLADPDADGLQNLLEYAAGLLPRDTDDAARPQAWIDDGRLHYAFTQAKAATDVLLELESSADLDAWTASGLPLIEEVSREDLGSHVRTVVRLAEPAGANPTGFLRLRIGRP